jgi:hypothetical protein
MRKFSNEKIGESVDNSTFRYKVKQLMDTYLQIGIYGPINPILQGTIKINGQEYFLNALMDMMEQNESKSEKSILENLIKSDKSIYERLQEINTYPVDRDRLNRIQSILDLKDSQLVNEQLTYMNLTKDEVEYINTIKN